MPLPSPTSPIASSVGDHHSSPSLPRIDAAKSHALAARKLTTHAGVASLLNAREGKMTLQQMQAAVVKQQNQAKRQEEMVANMAASQTGTITAAAVASPKASKTAPSFSATAPLSSSSHDSPLPPPPAGYRRSGHPLDYSESPDLDVVFAGGEDEEADEIDDDGDDIKRKNAKSEARHMQELVFSRALALSEAHERSLQINPTKHRIGAVLMSDEQRSEIEYEREWKKAKREANRRAHERERAQNACSSSARVVSMVGETTSRRPTFVVDLSEPWPARQRLLARMLQSVEKIATRRRVDQRLAALQHHANKRRQAKKNLDETADDESAAARIRSQHALLPSSLESDDTHVQRDFQLCVNNVQSVGFERGGDSVLRTTVELEEIEPSRALITLDEIVAFDANTQNYPQVGATPAILSSHNPTAGIVPSFISAGWLDKHWRTGAWEESLLRGPRGEMEAVAEERKVAAAAASAAAAAASSASSSDTLVIHAHLPSNSGGAGATAPLTSPAHTSASLLDVEASNSTPISLKPTPMTTTTATGTKKSAAATASLASPTAAAAAAGAAPSSPQRSPSSHLNSSSLHMPESFFSSFHPVAQRHTFASANNVSVAVDVNENYLSENGITHAFRAASLSNDPSLAPTFPAAAASPYYYTQEHAASSSTRTIHSVPALSDLWRPRREPPAAMGVGLLLSSLHLPTRLLPPRGGGGGGGSGGPLRGLPRADDIAQPEEDEQNPGLVFKPNKPTLQSSAGMFEHVPSAAASLTSSLAAAANTAAGKQPLSPSAASSSLPSSSAPLPTLDIGLGLQLLSTAIQFPPNLAVAAQRASQAAAHAVAAANNAGHAASVAATAAAGGTTARTARSSAAAEDAAGSARTSARGDGATSPTPDAAAGGGSRSSKKKASSSKDAAAAAAPSALSNLPPRDRHAHGRAAASGVVPGESGLSLLLPAGSVASLVTASAAQPAAAAALLPAATSAAVGQARAVEAFRVTAAAAAESGSDAVIPGAACNVAYGGVAAAAAVEQLAEWEQVAAANALPLATLQLRALTQHPNFALTRITHK